jgi:hypothetical protein
MYANIKVQKFDMKELGSRTLEIHTFKEDNCTLVIGKDVRTGELFVLHEEWEVQSAEEVK